VVDKLLHVVAHLDTGPTHS